MNNLLIVILVACVTQFADVIGDDFNDHYCIAQNNVAEADVRRYTTTFEHDDSREFRCYLKCSMLHFGLVNEAGDFNVDRLIEIVEKTVYIPMPTSEKLKIFSVCNNSRVSGDPCDKAAAAADCLSALFKPYINVGKAKTEENYDDLNILRKEEF